MTVAGRRDLRLDVAGAPLSRSLSVVGHEDVDFDDDELVGDGGAGGLHQDRESLDGGWIASARVMFINTSTAPLGGPPNGQPGQTRPASMMALGAPSASALPTTDVGEITLAGLRPRAGALLAAPSLALAELGWEAGGRSG
jgi:hypothetical protein